MNTEQIQALIEMLSGAGEGVKVVLIMYLIIPMLLHVINWSGISVLACFIFKGAKMLVTATRSESSLAFSDIDLQNMRDQLNIGTTGVFISSEAYELKETLKALVIQEKARRME
jgi:hypothetical protein